ncbi:MAG: sulfotransferase [Pseudomonadota bacterium]
MKKELHFLSGIPRSGSTVLAAILNQNPMTHVSTTSGLVHILDGMANTWTTAPLLGQQDPERDKLAQAMRGVIDAQYEDIEKPIIIDKSRGWPIPIIMSAMEKVIGHPCRIIATVRNVPDCAASFVRIAKPVDLDEFIQEGHLMVHLRAAYISLESGYKTYPECFCIVDYDDLMDNPKEQLRRIHTFLGLPDYEYDLSAIDGSTVSEDDENLHGYGGMHDIKPVLGRQHNEKAKDILGRHYFSFCQPEFWLERPKTILPIQPLDLQLTASLQGDFAEAWRLAQEIERDDPKNVRATYNRGWFYLRQGKIQKGYELLNIGRKESLFGKPRPDVPTPDWDGKSKGIVLLYLEGGLGDQIHQVRYAKEIAARGCKVVVSCAGQLCGLLKDVEGVSAIIQYEASFGCYHDYLVRGMTAILALGSELPDISGEPYIAKPTVIKGRRRCIGLRWRGNPVYENNLHRDFPSQLMFDAVKDTDADFISLQRDEGAELCPPWVRQVPLNTWEQTQEAIASCDLVISSCTSIVHLAGAMGIETWSIQPILPYYLFVFEGSRTPYYDSVTLFRQVVFGHWQAPFDRIKERLQQHNAVLRLVV